MFGNYQKSELRIEVPAAATQLQACLTETEQLRQWLWPQTFSAGMPGLLALGTEFSTWLGPIEVQHQVSVLEADRVRFMLSQGIDGFHEWSWGDQWVQSRLEGITLLPLNLGQTLTLLRLQIYLRSLDGA